ncbi:NUDIX domain-containing protein [Nocardia aobensis]|uniref:NUDIX domain-containing protein n=1 Tax=Nocardia aobensis TaxID=257277 RepID=A0ABW6P2K5_9NOCA
MRIESSRRLIDTVAWVLIEDGRILCARPDGKDEFYIPGGKREGEETDRQTLIREISEELTVVLIPESIAHVGTYEAELPGATEVSVRMSCYTADYAGTIEPGSEIAEIAWFSYADRAAVPPVDQALFDDLVARGLLPAH